VYFQGRIVREYFADLVVDGPIVVEVRAPSRLLIDNPRKIAGWKSAN
jgi:hypothetical protein